MHATDFWATDARKIWEKSLMRATYILDVGDPFNFALGKRQCDSCIRI